VGKIFGGLAEIANVRNSFSIFFTKKIHNICKLVQRIKIFIIYFRMWEESSEDSLTTKEGFYLGNLKPYTESCRFVKVIIIMYLICAFFI